MILKIVFLILWILLLICNTVYSRLSSNIQDIRWVRGAATVVAIIILLNGIAQEIKKFHNLRFAYVSSKDGVILKNKNFPWNIKKTERDKKVVYIIYNRYGDASEIAVNPDKPVRYNVDMTMTGVGIEFFCPETDIPNFTIKISN